MRVTARMRSRRAVFLIAVIPAQAGIQVGLPLGLHEPVIKATSEWMTRMRLKVRHAPE
jgi:hypothetical protein